MFSQCKLRFHYLLPKLALTRLAGWCAARRMGWLTQWIIKGFIRFYRVDMHQARQSDPASYQTFNAFFSRPLCDNARPIDADEQHLVMPADGIISQLGQIQPQGLLQAKGHYYSLQALLAGDQQMEKQFAGGQFATIYLSPADYHRVHMPCDGVLREMIYVPGQLFSVNPFTAEHVPNLFARNERVICYFDTPFGPLAQILVGATIVGSIETVWLGTVTPPRNGVIRRWSWHSEGDQAVRLVKGQHMGGFKLGSTVITLLAPGSADLLAHLALNSVTRVGQPLARASAALKPTAASSAC